MSAKDAFTNRLSKETSPYLLQHAHNPVDWFPWGQEAFDAARSSGKPIFLSVGYSACHWCHVMEHESFEDPATAKLMNDLYINVKVDREERPDIDQIYMNAVQLMTMRGGWPMSVWLTHDLKPFYGGTYFPPERKYGMPSFRDVLMGVADAWNNRRQEVLNAAADMANSIQRMGLVEHKPGEITKDLIVRAATELSGMVDPEWGGIGNAPKFPHSVELRLMLRASLMSGDAKYASQAITSLRRMSVGGIYDHLGGGFHRYSTDQKWLAPHFEKMLYDNALIGLALLEAFQFTRDEEFRESAIGTFDYVLREMQSPEGGYYSTQDADSEGEEGKFFVWSRDEVMQTLGPTAGPLFCKAYDVTEAGNWEGKNILYRFRSKSDFLAVNRLTEEELNSSLQKSRSLLLAQRNKRIAPGTDTKVLTSWNGLMIDAMATASRVLEDSRYRDSALRAATFVYDKLYVNGRLLHSFKDGQAKFNGYLEDYACLANGLVSLYEATFDPIWIQRAEQLVRVMAEQFWDAQDGGFFFTSGDHESLIARGKDPYDNATPSGNSMAATAIVRLAKLTGSKELTEYADKLFGLFRSVMDKSATAASQMLIALDIHLGPTQEFAIVGDADAPQTAESLREIYSRFLPNKVLAQQSSDVASHQQIIPLLEGKTGKRDKTLVYVCQDFSCQAPVESAAELSGLLERLPR